MDEIKALSDVGLVGAALVAVVILWRWSMSILDRYISHLEREISEDDGSQNDARR